MVVPAILLLWCDMSVSVYNLKTEYNKLIEYSPSKILLPPEPCLTKMGGSG